MAENPPNEWAATDFDNNAESTAVKAAVTTGRHVVSCILASYSAAATKLLTLKHGSTTVFTQYVVNSAVIPIPEGLRNANVNESVSAVLEASGAGGTIGTVTLIGYTI